MTERQKGTLYVFAAAFLFSFGGLGIKLIPWPPLAINAARNGISFFLIAAYLWRSKHRLVINRSVLTGSFCMFGTTTLYVIANKMTTAANAIVLQFTAPVFLIFIMWMFFGERPTKLDGITCAVVLAGIACFFVDGLSAGGTLGNLLALISGVTYAGVFLMGSTPGADSLSSILIGQGVSALVGLPYLLSVRDFSAVPVASAVFLGVFQLGLAYICFSKGLAATPPVTASLTTGIEPILNPVWVAVFYGERITMLSMTGGLIVVGAILIYNVRKAQNQKKAEAQTLSA